MATRNLELEKKNLGDLLKNNPGKDINNLTPDDWKLIHTASYGTDLPSDLASLPMYQQASTNPSANTTPALNYQGADISDTALTGARNEALSYNTSGFLDKVKQRLQEKFKPETEVLGLGSFSATLGALDPNGVMQGISEKTGQFRRKGALALQALSTANDIYSEQAKLAYTKLNDLEAKRAEYETGQKDFEADAKDLALKYAEGGNDIPTTILDMLPQKLRAGYEALPQMYRDKLEREKNKDLTTINGTEYVFDEDTNSYILPTIGKSGGSVSWRNNNPLNIKFGDFASKYGATAGTKATDGGVFANFPDIETGLRAAKELLRGSSYSNLTLDAAMRRWSGNGYGQDVTSKELWGKKIKDLSDNQINRLIEDMQRREGWIEGKSEESSDDEYKIAKDIFDGTSSLTVSQLPTAKREKVNKYLSEMKSEAKKSGDVMGIINSSAGGKDVDSSFITSFDKAINVIYQIGDLQNSFKNDNKSDIINIGKSNGLDLNPIWGKVRKMNPWSSSAQEIKAQLQAIVPNLARGIYGEVGVLTDNDIKNYSQTLPTLTSSEQVRSAVLAFTVKSVQRAIENKLKSQAGAGRDVSGYKDMYSEIKTLADKLLTEAGFKVEGGMSKETTTPQANQKDLDYINSLGLQE